MLKLELNDQEASEFVQWRKNQDFFSALIEAGTFGIKNGKVVLHFDSDGKMRKIDIEYIGWKI